MGIMARKDLEAAPDLQAGFEMALLRMLAFRPQQHAGQINTMVAPSKPHGLESPVVMQPEPALAPESDPEPEPEPDEVPKEVQKPKDIAAPIVDSPPWEDEPEYEQQPASELLPVEQQATLMPVQEAPVVKDVLAVQDTSAVQDPPVMSAELILDKPQIDWTLADLSENNWTQVFNDLNVSGMTHGIAANMVFNQRQGTHLQFTLDQGQSSMLNATHQGRIRQALEDMFGCELKLTIDIGQTEIETPFASRQRREMQHQDHAILSLQEDPNIASLTTAFNGQLDINSVLPVNPIKN